MRTKIYVALGFILLIGIFLRFYLLWAFPVQLGHDEVSQLYDAISIAQTGKDIYGNFLPLIFPSVNDFKPPFYTYATVLTYFILGNKEIIIRVPGAFFGVLIIPAVFLFSFRLFKKIKISLLASFITAIAPFEIFFSRKSFENGAGVFFMLLGFSSLYIFLENKKKVSWLYGGILLLMVGLYTYFSHAIIIPLLLFSFLIIYRKDFLVNLKRYIFPFIFLVVLITPLILLVTTNAESRYRAQSVFILQDPILGKEIQNVKSENNLLTYIFTQKSVIEYMFNRYLEQFNLTYLFASGLDFTNQGLIDIGPLLFVLLPFLFFGFVYLIKIDDFSKEKKFILAWILIGTLPSGLTNEEHSPHRIIMVFTMLDIIIACGIFYFADLLSKLKKIRLLVYTSLVFLVCFNMLFFFNMYFVNFPYEKSQEIHYPFKQVALFMWSQYGNYQQIIFDPLFGESAPKIGTAVHYYIGYYGNYPPEKFQKAYTIGNKDREVLLDKMDIRKVNWLEDQNLKNTLIIASSWSIPIDSIDKSKVIKTFYFYNRLPAFYAIKL